MDADEPMSAPPPVYLGAEELSEAVLLLDAGALVASVDRGESRHGAVGKIIDDARRPLVTSQVVLAEVDYLVLAARYGTSTIVTLDERCFRG